MSTVRPGPGSKDPEAMDTLLVAIGFVVVSFA